MQGTNELHLNEATMKEAMQSWLDKKMISAPTVTSVRLKDPPSPHSSTFIVTVDADADREGPSDGTE